MRENKGRAKRKIMKWNKALILINIVFPLAGLGLMIFYEVCDTSCSYLQGTFLGLDLRMIGIIFMALLMLMMLPQISRYRIISLHLRTMMLAGAAGGEILLVRFQIVNDTYCQFCLVFGLCVLILFAANFARMNTLLAAASFLGGIGAFALFFRGTVLPLYSLLF